MKTKAWFVLYALGLTLTLFVGAHASEDQPKTSIKTEPLTGFSGKSQAFGNLPPLGNYMEPSKGLEIRRPDHRNAVYDRVVRPFPALQVVEAMDQVANLAGAAGGAALGRRSQNLAEPQAWNGTMRRPFIKPATNPRSTPDTLGPMDTNQNAQTSAVFGSYQGAIRVRVLDDKTYGIYTFAPFQDSRGRYISTDPTHPANWRLLSKEEAIDRLHSSMSYQTTLHKAPDSTYKTLFEKTSGVTWKNHFAALYTTQGPKFSQSLRMSQDQKVAVKMPGQQSPAPTSVRSFLKGNFAERKPVAVQRPPSGFANIGASSFGARGRLANVWHKEVQGAPVNRTVQDTLKQARQTKAQDVSVVFNAAGKNSALEIKRALESQGLKVRMVPDQMHSKTTLVASGMGASLQNPHKSAIVLWVDRSQAGGGSLPKGNMVNHTGDYNDGPNKMGGVAKIAPPPPAPPLPAPTTPVKYLEQKVAAPAPAPTVSPGPSVAMGSSPSVTSLPLTPPVTRSYIAPAPYSPPMRGASYSPPACRGFSSGPSSFRMPSFSQPRSRR